MGLLDPLLKAGAKEMLAQVRSSGRFAGMPATSKDVKKAYRLMYHNDGPNEADKFATGWRTSRNSRSVLIDAQRGPYPEEYPRGGGRLPKGALNDSARTAAKRAALRAKKKHKGRGV